MMKTKNERRLLLEMVDGGIVKINDDKMSYDGCDTCDYGSQYINEFIITLTGIKILVKASQMYEYAMSNGTVMQILLPNIDKIANMTELEFSNWIEVQFKNICDFDAYSQSTINVSYENIKSTTNYPKG